MSTSLLSFPAEVREALAFWQCLRGMGVAADDLFVGCLGGKITIRVALEGRAPVDFVLREGSGLSSHAFGALWMAMADLIAGFPPDDIVLNNREWLPVRRLSEFVFLLQRHLPHLHMP